MNYIGMKENKGIIVGKETAFDYALERIINGTDEEKAEFVKWFYSGNWYWEESE